MEYGEALPTAWYGVRVFWRRKWEALPVVVFFAIFNVLFKLVLGIQEQHEADVWSQTLFILIWLGLSVLAGVFWTQKLFHSPLKTGAWRLVAIRPVLIQGATFWGVTVLLSVPLAAAMSLFGHFSSTPFEWLVFFIVLVVVPYYLFWLIWSLKMSFGLAAAALGDQENSVVQLRRMKGVKPIECLLALAFANFWATFRYAGILLLPFFLGVMLIKSHPILGLFLLGVGVGFEICLWWTISAAFYCKLTSKEGTERMLGGYAL